MLRPPSYGQSVWILNCSSRWFNLCQTVTLEQAFAPADLLRSVEWRVAEDVVLAVHLFNPHTHTHASSPTLIFNQLNQHGGRHRWQRVYLFFVCFIWSDLIFLKNYIFRGNTQETRLSCAWKEILFTFYLHSRDLCVTIAPLRGKGVNCTLAGGGVVETKTVMWILSAVGESSVIIQLLAEYTDNSGGILRHVNYYDET